MRRFVVVALLVAASAASGPQARADDVTVVFTAAAAVNTTRPAVACPVAVAEGANGVAVLDAAVAAGCISGYALDTFDIGSFVRCIDGVCGGADGLGALCWFWAFFDNGVFADYGVDGFNADDGDVITFVHTPYGPVAAGFC